jgi:excisionase family DNA binding protein
MAVERLTFTVTEVAEILGLSRSKTYELVATGEIPVLPIPGRRKLVARSTVRRLLGEPPLATRGTAQAAWRRAHLVSAAHPAVGIASATGAPDTATRP